MTSFMIRVKLGSNCPRSGVAIARSTRGSAMVGPGPMRIRDSGAGSSNDPPGAAIELLIALARAFEHCTRAAGPRGGTGLSSWAFLWASVGVCGDPVPRDIDAPADPDALVLQHVIEKARQPRGASRSAGESHVQADGHHLGSRRALGVEHVECIA